VRLHHRHLANPEWINLRGLLATRPARIASDLLYDREDPGAVAHLIADSIRAADDSPGALADALTPHAARFGLRPRDGLALLRWLVDLVGGADTSSWMDEAKAHADRRRAKDDQPQAAAG
jgi:hypothetical protein